MFVKQLFAQTKFIRIKSIGLNLDIVDSDSITHFYSNENDATQN